ncbi:MAG: hypothetical protein K5889_08635 [Lachnospiraceae bacterium]|nr:hypothetical protein [Lachnospiraceae bacterium]
MKNETSGIIIVNHVLSITQLICCGLAFYALSRFSALAATDSSHLMEEWGLLFGGALLINGMIAVVLAMIPLCLANMVVSTFVLKRYGKRLSAILSLILSVLALILTAFVIVTEML